MMAGSGGPERPPGCALSSKPPTPGPIFAKVFKPIMRAENFGPSTVGRLSRLPNKETDYELESKRNCMPVRVCNGNRGGVGNLRAGAGEHPRRDVLQRQAGSYRGFPGRDQGLHGASGEGRLGSLQYYVGFTHWPQSICARHLLQQMGGSRCRAQIVQCTERRVLAARRSDARSFILGSG